MKRLALMVSLAVLVSAGTAMAQSACPHDGSCPTDVGACLAESCPCAAPGNGNGNAGWKNHGQYVKCVVHLRNDLRKAGCLDKAAKTTIAKCAAKSTCGKEGFTLCCFYNVTCSDTNQTDGIASGVCSTDGATACNTALDCVSCSDATPNGTAEGTCSNDSSVACDTASDCITATGPKIAHDSGNCADRGGTDIGGGSVCGGCPAVPPAPSAP